MINPLLLFIKGKLDILAPVVQVEMHKDFATRERYASLRALLLG